MALLLCFFCIATTCVFAGDPPVITKDLTNSFATPHSPFSFNVIVTGSAPLFSQWVFNGTNIPNATNQSYGFTSADPRMAGNYAIVVSNAFGATTSSIVTLTVSPLWIAVPPTNLSVAYSYPARLVVIAGGTQPISYQWQLNGQPISGARADSLIFLSAGLTNAGEYTVVVGNSSGRMTSSPPAVVSVRLPFSFGTLAGSGTAGSRDDFGTAAQFRAPGGVAADSFGNVFVADSQNNVIRKIGQDGLVTTVAGTPLAGSADGTGGRALFSNPQGIASDTHGNLYITDAGNNTIRKIDAHLAVTTLAGSPGVKGSSDGIGSTALFSSPSGVAVGGDGTLYVADTFNHTIRTIAPDGTVATFAGLAGSLGSANGIGSNARFTFPWRIAVDAAGNIYVAGADHLVRKIDSATNVTTLAGAPNSVSQADGKGSSAKFANFGGLTTDVLGNIYTLDGPNWRFCKITPDGTVTTMGASSPLGFADGAGANVEFNNPSGIATDGNGRFYVADAGNNRIRVGLVGLGPTLVTQPQDQTAAAGTGASLSGLAVGAEPLSYQWQRDGINLPGQTNASISFPTIQPTNAGLYSLIVTNAFTAVTSAIPAKITVIAVPPAIAQQPTSQTSPVGSNVSLSVSASGSGPLSYQWQFNGTNLPGATNATVTLAQAATNVTGNYTVIVSNAFGTATSLPAELTVASEGIAAASGDADAVIGYPFALNITAFGAPYIRYLWQLDGAYIPGATTASLNLTNVDISNAGVYSNQPSIIVASNGTFYLHIIDTISATIAAIPPFDFVTLAGTNVAGSSDGDGMAARFSGPAGIAADKDGIVYVADTLNHTIRKISPSGAVTTWAGAPGAAGAEDGSLQKARFAKPQGIAFDGNGNLYIADTGNSTVRKISADGVVSTIAGYPGTHGYRDGAGATARFFNPLNVACDSTGNIYVADNASNPIRKVTPDGYVTSLAGPPGVNGRIVADAYGLAPDSLGNLYITESFGTVVSLVGPSGLVTTVAGQFHAGGITNSFGPFARFSAPAGLARDASGNLYVTDGPIIRRVTPDGAVTTIAGLEGSAGFSDGSGRAANFNNPLAIAVDAQGVLYVADTGNNAIRAGRSPSPLAPSLQISSDGIETEVSWKLPATGFVLEITPSLFPASWSTVAGGVSTTNGQAVFRTAIGPSAVFFRLRKP